MKTATDFKRYAYACRSFAQSVSGDGHRKLLLDMAKTWLVLAAEQEGVIMHPLDQSYDQLPPGPRRLH